MWYQALLTSNSPHLFPVCHPDQSENGSSAESPLGQHRRRWPNSDPKPRWRPHSFPWIQNICITFIQRRPNVFDVGPTLFKCYTNVLCSPASAIEEDISLPASGQIRKKVAFRLCGLQLVIRGATGRWVGVTVGLGLPAMEPPEDKRQDGQPVD